MARTRRQREDERAEQVRKARERVWEDFEPKLRALETFRDARELVAQAPPPDSPGREYYSNLGFFLQAFTVPHGSSSYERNLYLEFVRKLDAAGALKPGGLSKVEESFRQAQI